MRKLGIGLFIIAGSLAGFIVALGVFYPATGSVTTAPTTREAEVLTEAEEPAGLPVRISIPSIGVDAQMEFVGLDTEGKMDVPKDFDNVGWFELGYRPGEKGNAVMAGHLDTAYGGTAVFYRLKELTSGDEIYVYDEEGNELRFIVTGVEIFPFDRVPLAEIFGPSEERMLNLITCEGVFDNSNQNYSDRTVVYSVMGE